MSTPLWQERRRSFTHDWLKWKYLPKLGKLVNLLSNKLPFDYQFEQEIANDLFDWPVKSSEAKKLIAEFPRSMSATNILPVDDSITSWMTETVHKFWVSKNNVETICQDASDTLLAADLSFEALRAAIEQLGPFSLATLKPHLAKVVDFRKQCQSVGEAFSQFPGSICVLK